MAEGLPTLATLVQPLSCVLSYVVLATVQTVEGLLSSVAVPPATRDAFCLKAFLQWRHSQGLFPGQILRWWVREEQSPKASTHSTHPTHSTVFFLAGTLRC